MMVEIKLQNYYFLSIYKGEMKSVVYIFSKYHGSDLTLVEDFVRFWN